jgi:quinoprotein glucose dehydrogenase
MLEASADKDAYLRHAGVMALTWIGDTSQLMAAAKHDSPAVRMAACLALRRLGRSDVAVFLKDSQPRIVTEAARAINDAQIEAAQPQLAAMLGSVTLPETVILRALNANFRLGGAENATAVAHFAARGDAPELMRNEALAILAAWDKPRGIDRVVGIWRPFTPATRDPQLAIKAARPVLPGIITSAPDSVRIAAIDLIKKIGLDDANVLFDLVANKDVSPDVAAAALAAMDQRKDARLNEAVDVALKTGKASLRAAAIQMLVHRDDATNRLESLLATGSIADQQAVLTALGTIDQPAAEQILSSWMDRLLKEGNVPPEVQLDLLDAAGKSKSDAIKMKVKQYDERRKKDDPVAQYAECLLGGDAAAGRKIFLERQDVSCLRCHKLDGTGGVAGPDLTGVGSRHPRDYFLESIVNPNAKIAPGFESVTAKMKAGKYYTGVVKGDTDAELVVDSGDGAVVHLDKKEIATRTKGLSPMPQDISKTLSKRDVRDLVEFLTNLKQPATQPAGTAPQK